jgi:hypothetical protein
MAEKKKAPKKTAKAKPSPQPKKVTEINGKVRLKSVDRHTVRLELVYDRGIIQSDKRFDLPVSCVLKNFDPTMMDVSGVFAIKIICKHK